MKDQPKNTTPSKDKIKADYYFENGLMVMTEEFHLKRGYCCGSCCRHCPFDHKNVDDSSQRKN